LRVIGLMSGTSLDGIDAAIVRFEGTPDDLRWTLEAFHSTPYSAEQRRSIHDAIVAGGAAGLCVLHARLGEWLADAALDACERAGRRTDEVDLIGSHGQTVWHEPPRAGERGATLQLGCAATIAERTGIDVISDFRSRDVAAGGHGAPLVPWIDRALFALPGGARVLLNIGGMANLTRVPPRGAKQPVLAFDTGPGNALIDAAVELATGGAETFDRDGARAASGTADEALLAELLAHPWFAAAPPRSTGREVFGRPYVEALVARRPIAGDVAWNDLAATLTEFTVRTIADAVRRWVLPLGAAELVVTGGGARNPRIVQGLAAALAPLPVRTGEAIGIDPDAKEALAFAALAWAHAHGVAGNVPEATGASGPRVLGSRTPGAARGP
jgi:anhydro-N-acetylmuramic acid kinase